MVGAPIVRRERKEVRGKLLVIGLLLAYHSIRWVLGLPPVGVALSSACSPIQMVLSGLRVSSSLGRTVMVTCVVSFNLLKVFSPITV